jgi:APA family basic amino acid/polyamine antiporter
MSTPAVTAAPKALGLLACTALVVGNMVGSGFYLSPAALAPYGLLAPLAWIVMGGGAICLGLSFARLARLVPATGGPYAYAHAAYGDFPGFLVAWGYWISIWCSLPAIAVAFTGYLIEFVPAMRGNRPLVIGVTLGAIWLVALVNLRGVRSAGVFAELTTLTKLVPLAVIALLGLFFADFGNFSEFNPSGESLLGASGALAPLTMFAYLGLESATVPAGDVRDPERTIPRATMLGIGIAALVYVLGTVSVMGVLPREQLAESPAPFADAATAMWGPWAGGVLGVAVMISSIGALNGWTLLMGQVPMAAAQDGLFPAMFGRVSARGVPAFGIVVSASLATALLLIQASGGTRMAGFYSAVVNLSTMTAVVPYVFCAGAAVILTRRATGTLHVSPIDLIAYAFSLFTVWGCGAEAVLYGFLLLMLGIPFYVRTVRERQHAGLLNRQPPRLGEA